jgi:hypothetical protein
MTNEIFTKIVLVAGPLLGVYLQHILSTKKEVGRYLLDAKYTMYLDICNKVAKLLVFNERFRALHVSRDMIDKGCELREILSTAKKYHMFDLDDVNDFYHIADEVTEAIYAIEPFVGADVKVQLNTLRTCIITTVTMDPPIEPRKHDIKKSNRDSYTEQELDAMRDIQIRLIQVSQIWPNLSKALQHDLIQ